MILFRQLIKDKIPDKVNGSFYCVNNELISLEGCPIEVSESFYVQKNQLTSLLDKAGKSVCPLSIGLYFDCSYNKLTSLEGCPISVGMELHCDNNLVDLSIERDFIKAGACFAQKTYWPDLLKYMIDQKIDLDKVFGWPKDFLNDNVIKSSKGIIKFNL
jgi:hypothetical protein